MTSPPDVELARLLRALFTAEELARFLRSHYRDVADELPTNVGIIPLASAAAEALARHNLVDTTLFTHLHNHRAHCTKQIELAAQACRPGAAPALRRPLRYALLACLVGAVTATAAALDGLRADSGAVQCTNGRCDRDGPATTAGLYSDPPGPSTTASMECLDGMVQVTLSNPTRFLCLDRTEVTRGAFCTSPIARRNILSKQELDRCTPDPAIERWAEHPISMIRADEAESFCRERGLRLPERREFAQILAAEVGGRSLVSLLPAMNICDADCYQGRELSMPFTHHDGYGGTAPVGTYHEKFVSQTGLDDIFGNVREFVVEGAKAYVCGSSYLHSRLSDLGPEHCLSSQNMPVVAGGTKKTVGFRCAGDPGTGALRRSAVRASE